MCNRPLTTQEKQAVISRFTVPNFLTLGQPQSAGINLVMMPLPGGFVTTTFAANGLLGTNVTTPFHVFTGTVDRSISNRSDGAYMNTHGYGGYAPVSLPPPDPFASMETGGAELNLGEILDNLNAVAGPEIFNLADQQAARCAQAHFPGC